MTKRQPNTRLGAPKNSFLGQHSEHSSHHVHREHEIIPSVNIFLVIFGTETNGEL